MCQIHSKFIVGLTHEHVSTVEPSMALDFGTSSRWSSPRKLKISCTPQGKLVHGTSDSHIQGPTLHTPIHFTFSILLMIVQRCGLALGRPALRCTECTLTDWMCMGSVPHHRKSTWSWGIAKISRRALLTPSSCETEVGSLKAPVARRLLLGALYLPTAHCRHIVSCSQPVA